MANETAGHDTAETETETDSSTDQPVTMAALTKLLGDFKEGLKQETSKMVNTAIASKVGRKKDKEETATAPAQTEADDKPSTRLASVERELQSLKAEREKFRLEARQSKAEQALTSLLDGKVSSTWKDVALSEITKLVVFDEDEASLSIGGMAYTFEDGAKEWLKSPSSKRFLPVPESRPTSNGRPLPASVSGKPQSQMTAEDKAATVGALLISKGL